MVGSQPIGKPTEPAASDQPARIRIWACTALASSFFATSSLVACASPHAAPDDHLASSGTSAEHQEPTPGNATVSEPTPELSVDEERFLRRVVPGFEQLMVAGIPRTALDAWAEGATSQQIWFPGPELNSVSGCVPAPFERNGYGGWSGQLPICPNLVERAEDAAQCHIELDQSLSGSVLTYLIAFADLSAQGGTMSHGCSIPTNLSGMHWGNDQLTFGGVCASVEVSCSVQTTTQTCRDGSLRTCSHCTDLQTHVSDCGSVPTSVHHTMTLDVGPASPVDCSRPCESGVTADEVEQANAILSRVDWMHTAEPQLSLYRTAESCAGDVGSIEITVQARACGLVESALEP